jgi:hypothetical protein
VSEAERGVIGGEERQGVVRALVLGFAIAIGTSLVIPYFDNVLSTSSPLESHFPLAILLPFVFLVTLYNLAAKLLHPRLVLRTHELLVVFVVGYTGVMAQGIIQRLIAQLASPYYYGSAENQWPELVWPLLPTWCLPNNDTKALDLFFGGLPPGAAPPWYAWAPTLVWWLGFVAAIIFVCLALSVMLRKQWVEHERVEFPLAQIPLQLAISAGQRALVPGVFRKRLFWIGFVLPAFVITWRILTWFHPSVPYIAFALDTTEIELGRDFPESFYARVNFFIIGFAYFTRLEILLSIWFFNWLALIQAGITRSIGFGLDEETAFVGDQAQGGLFFFVLWGLWMSRRHLANVFRKAFRRAPDVDDAGEYLSYRTATFGLILGVAFIWVFMVKAGMTWISAGLFLFACLVIYLGLAKIIALSGLVYLRPTWSAQATMRPFFSAEDFGPGTVVGYNMMYAVRGQDKGYMMPSMMAAQALQGYVRRHGRAVGKSILAASILAAALYAMSTLHLAYTRGAANFNNSIFTAAGQRPYGYMARSLQPSPPRESIAPTRRTFFFVGAGATALLTALTYRFPWWPLHPAGLTVAWGWPIFFSSLSIFIAWLVKAIILKVGGLKLYRHGQPFFIGLIIGQAAGILAGMVVDLIWFPGAGHPLLGGGD